MKAACGLSRDSVASNDPTMLALFLPGSLTSVKSRSVERPYNAQRALPCYLVRADEAIR
jgi:hypothetical protein